MNAHPVATFLRGRARPNPRPAPPWRLELRHAEGGPWGPFEEAARRAPLVEEMRAPRRPLSRGDAVRLVDPSGFSRRTWVMAGDGARPVPDPVDWQAAWEWTFPVLQMRLRLCTRVPHRRLVAAMLSLAEALEARLPASPPPGGRAAEAAGYRAELLAAARAWLDGPEDEAAERAAERRLVELRGRFEAWEDDSGLPALRVVRLVGFVAAARSRAFGGTRRERDGRVLEAAMDVIDGLADAERARGLGPWDYRPIFDRHLPLTEVLLAQAGDPTPWAGYGAPP